MSGMLQPGTGTMGGVAVHGSDPSTSHPNAGLIPPTENPEKKELMILVEMGRWVLAVELTGNEPSSPSRLPGPQALMRGLVVEMLLGQQGRGQGLYRGHPSLGSLAGVQCPSVHPGCALLTVQSQTVHTGRRG